MRKHAQKKRSSVPPDQALLLPVGEREVATFQNDIDKWFSEWENSNPYYGPAFKRWCEEIIRNSTCTLLKLYQRYGLRPSKILGSLANCKHHLLTQAQLESGDWMKDVPDWYIGQAQLTRLDSQMMKILRNKKLNERNARILEEAARVLIVYPPFLGVVADWPNPFELPNRLKLIAADMRQRLRHANHRPQLQPASYVLWFLSGDFKHALGKPLYEYAGTLTKACFPEEWNPAGDIREAAKKLNKSYDARLRRAGEEAGL